MGENGGVTADKYGVSFRGDKNVPELVVVVVTKLCEYTKNHSIEHLKHMNYIICKLYNINKVIKKRKPSNARLEWYIPL